MRPFSPADAGEVQRLAGRREVSETTLNIPHPYRDGMAEKWISSNAIGWSDGSSITYAITLKDSGQLIGAISLTEIDGGHAELGYWIGLPYWDNGYCTEAARKLIEIAREEFGISDIRAVHLLTNPASGRVLQKVGLRHAGIERMRDRHGDMVEIGVYLSNPGRPQTED